MGLLIMGIGCLALAGGISAHGLRLRRRRFFVCPGGLVVTHGGHVDVYPWDNIVRVTENSERDTLCFVPVGTYRAAVVQRIDGAVLVLDRNRVKGVGKLIDAIQDQIWKRRSGQQLLDTDPDLKVLVATWPSLPANVRTEILALVEKTAATGAPFGGPASSNDLHVDLRVSQGQANRGETVTLNLPDVGSFRVALPKGIQSGTKIRLRHALPNQQHLISHVQIDR